jgi:BspA type Leucine rich repeat region (6 copies)
VRRSLIQVCLLIAALLPVLVQAQYNYSDNGDGTCTITGYIGSGGDIVIPDTIDGLTVTSIGVRAFNSYSGLTNISIPNSVTSIGIQAFYRCTNLVGVTIGNSVTNVGFFAFEDCTNLTSALFLGNAPIDNGTAFGDSHPAAFYPIIYYLPGTTGWGTTFSGDLAFLDNLKAHSISFRHGNFGFDLTGPPKTVFVVEACTNLPNPVWLPIATNTFSFIGTNTFNDAQWTNYSTRFYRFRSP